MKCNSLKTLAILFILFIPLFTFIPHVDVANTITYDASTDYITVMEGMSLP